jgi:predicted enzyme related to lactoylglutathione lyase
VLLHRRFPALYLAKNSCVRRSLEAQSQLCEACGMSDETMKPGSVGWMDLTVKNATEVAHFYRDVVGHQLSEIEMGGYSDYVLGTSPENGVAGVCHARGENTNQPAVWMLYFTVADMDASVAKVKEHGGKLRGEVRTLGEMGRMAVIEDPSGAIAALYEAAKPS